MYSRRTACATKTSCVLQKNTFVLQSKILYRRGLFPALFLLSSPSPLGIVPRRKQEIKGRTSDLRKKGPAAMSKTNKLWAQDKRGGIIVSRVRNKTALHCLSRRRWFRPREHCRTRISYSFEQLLQRGFQKHLLNSSFIIQGCPSYMLIQRNKQETSVYEQCIQLYI